jgi:hypothetical protein
LFQSVIAQHLREVGRLRLVSPEIWEGYCRFEVAGMLTLQGYVVNFVPSRLSTTKLPRTIAARNLAQRSMVE